MTPACRPHIVLSIALLALFFCPSAPARAALILVEAESFDDPGGWVLDQQSMDQMGSPYLLAHGFGVPVADAVTTVALPTPGTYRVWVRTRDWVATWNAPGAPGRFQLLVDGRPLATTFGTEGANWHWQDGGAVDIQAATARLALHDLTGFEGRCDAIVLSSDMGFVPPNEGDAMSAFRRKALGLPDQAEDAGRFDLVVVGGGMAGTCTAISAARLGLQVALVQNRPILGGNNSSEIRVHLNGEINLPPYPRLGDVVRELDSGKRGNAQPASHYDDERKLRVVRAEPNIHLFLNTHAYEVEKQGDRIVAVLARELTTSREMRFAAPLFADCTGDGTIGYLAGADWRMGRESKAETGEEMAPETPDKMTMGASVQWYSAKMDQPSPFPDCPWALNFSKASCQNATRGDWDWESGLNNDQITDIELIRDHTFRAIYGNWAFQKNHSKDKARYANLKLDWVAYIAGKRESRRLLGDVVLQQQDVQEFREFPDAFVTTTWSIDLHYPAPKNSEHFPGMEFRTICVQPDIKPYPIPYRCLYSRNVENLFMAGRNISVTHVALGTIRVMRTGGMMGELVGMAASLCAKHDTTPRGVYENHLDELKALATRGVGKGVWQPQAKRSPEPAERLGDGAPGQANRAIEQASRSAQIAGYALSKVQRWLHEKALPVIDPQTGLYPADGRWNYRDTAADCYPFLCWAAFVVDKAALDGPVREILRAEQKLCNHLDRIPTPYDWQNKQKIEVDYDELIFQASEYVKDGLIAIVEVTGKDEWFDRMLAIEEDIWKHARYDTPHGRIPSKNVEVNGEQLQALARLYTMTGREEFLTWAERLADYYFDQPDFVPTRLRDHGCEIIGGLGLLYAVEVQQNRSKARVYEARLKHVFDTILAQGCNDDGMMYNHLTARDGGNGKLSDGWGYNYVGYLCYDMALGRPVYRTQVERTLRNLLKPAYDNYNWEGNYSIDGFADSIEGAIYLLNRVPVEEGFAWGDREMARSVTRSSEPLDTAELWGTMKLEANGVRTVLMHALMHTQGIIARPWQKGLQLGAARIASASDERPATSDGIIIVVRSDQSWSGTLCFDIPRHREYMGFTQDWPRMNTLPEWYTVEPAQKYTVEGPDKAVTATGRSLHKGLPLTLEPGQEKHLLIRPAR